MRTRWHLALMALVLLGCGNLWAAAYPTADQLRTAIAVAVKVVQAEGLVLKVENAREAGVTQPLMAAGLDLPDGVCLVFYNDQPEAGLQRFFAGVAEQDLPLWLGAIAVHEATHCIEQREVYIRRHFDKVLPPDVSPEGMTLQGYLGVVKSGAVETWGEALADIASALYVKQVAPDRWRSFTRSIIAMRRDLAEKWPSHDTSPWLRQLLDAPAATLNVANCFESAFQLRRELRPL